MEHRYAGQRSQFLDALRPGSYGQDGASGALPIYYNRQHTAPAPAYDNAKRLRRGYPWVRFTVQLGVLDPSRLDFPFHSTHFPLSNPPKTNGMKLNIQFIGRC